MSANYPQNWRVMLAVFLATGLIIGSYVVARDAESPALAQASMETELLEKIAARDVDNDGLSDWQEVLYGTDPRVTDTRNLGMSDGAAVGKGLIVPVAASKGVPESSTAQNIPGIDPKLPIPAEGTITRALSESFLTTYAKALRNSPDGSLSQDDIQNIARDVLGQLDQAFIPAPDFRTMDNLKVSGSGPEAMKVFAASAEGVMLAYRAHASTTELTHLKYALENDDESALLPIASIAKAYQDSAVGLAALPVPSELAGDHLQFVNSMARVGKTIEDFTRANSDPIATLLALKQYPEAVKSLADALIQISAKYRQASITFAPGEAGGRFVTIVDRVVERQKKSASAP